MNSWAAKNWAGATMAALILGAAAPALAGGYWDAGNAAIDPAAGPAPCRLHGPPCPPPPCPQERQGAWREHDSQAWSEGSAWRGEVRRDEEANVVVPAEFFETGGVGPDFLYDDEGGGGGYVEGGASASAGAFASASASVDISLREHERFGHERHMMPPPRQPMRCPPQRHMMAHWSGARGRR